MKEEAVASPCIKKCMLDEQRICKGCGRTADEIAAWLTVDDETRRGIVLAAVLRKKERQGQEDRPHD